MADVLLVTKEDEEDFEIDEEGDQVGLALHPVGNCVFNMSVRIPSRVKQDGKQGQDESLSDFQAAIKCLSEYCNFGDNLKPTLRYRFVCGLKDEIIQSRLLQEPNLTFDKATSFALAMETAKIHGGSSPPSSVHKLSTDPNRKKSHKSYKKPHDITYPPCQSCGKTNHKRADSFWRDASCKRCKKKRHIQAVCRSKTPPRQGPKKVQHVHEIKKEEYKDEFYALEMHQSVLSDRTPKMMLSLKINHIETQMELDTGSAVSVMTVDDYKEMFGKLPTMAPSKLCLRTYTNEVIEPLGTLPVKVNVNEQKKTLPLLILNKGGHPILERDWLSVLKLDWRNSNYISQ
ncbi:transposon tf2-8 polyprotein [Plakobranchus ocellatus]|uniref:Transposon tf2-8 polyprotein n=1 Tax=Plakobranchus ocellatus TaxID=259542 RepID=A0AAV3YGE2_9GAST|nr:transposon tf2-8 polyprotein [Plakobranchus ocellatus]